VQILVRQVCPFLKPGTGREGEGNALVLCLLLSPPSVGIGRKKTNPTRRGWPNSNSRKKGGNAGGSLGLDDTFYVLRRARGGGKKKGRKGGETSRSLIAYETY